MGHLRDPSGGTRGRLRERLPRLPSMTDRNTANSDWPCLRTADKYPRTAAKRSPSSVRNVPETFCRTLTIRKSLSASFLSKGTFRSVRKQSTPFRFVSRRSRKLPVKLWAELYRGVLGQTCDQEVIACRAERLAGPDHLSCARPGGGIRGLCQFPAMMSIAPGLGTGIGIIGRQPMMDGGAGAIREIVFHGVNGVPSRLGWQTTGEQRRRDRVKPVPVAHHARFHRC